MGPRSPIHDSSYCCLAYAKLGSQFALGDSASGISPSDFTNLIWDKPAPCPSALGDKPVFCRVLNVFLLGNVFQIVNPIILFIAVFMIDLVFRRARPDKRFSNQVVHSSLFDVAVLAQTNGIISSRKRGASQNTTSPSIRGCIFSKNKPIQRPHLPEIADLIETFISRNVVPLFYHHVLQCKNSPPTVPECANRRVCRKAAKVIVSYSV